MRTHPLPRTLLRAAVPAVLLSLACATVAQSQYYDEPVEPQETHRFVFLGVGPADFAPLGSNEAPDSTRISYTSVMPLVGIRQGSFELLLGYTRYTLGGTTRSGITAQTTVGFDLVLSGGRAEALVLPILLAGDYTKAEASGPARTDFNLGSVGAGAGLAYRRSSGALELAAEAGQLLQYSFEGFGTVYGFSTATLIRLTLILPRLPVLDGMAFGYRFRYQSWSMSDKTLNYRLLMHGLSVGILL